MSGHTLAMTDTLREYLNRAWLREPPILSRLREETAALGSAASMQIAPEQGQLMALILELIGAERVLEIGAFTGYSALSMARALPEHGRLITCDVSDDYTRIARRYWKEAGVADRIELRLAPARETLNQLLAQGEAETFDACFIDADKESYEEYYELALRLVRPGGLIMLDNVFWSGRVADPEVDDDTTAALRRTNARLHGDERVTLAVVPIADGLTLARKRPGSAQGGPARS